jgi:protein-tyrosine phosphatase
MAEYFARQWLQQKHSEHFTILSRALTDQYEPPGSPASTNGVIVMKEDFDIDMNSHRSALLTQADVDRADAIVGVTLSHIDFISANFAGATGKVYSMNRDVSDPWHAPLETYRSCAHQLSSLIPLVVGKVVDTITSKYIDTSKEK